MIIRCSFKFLTSFLFFILFVPICLNYNCRCLALLFFNNKTLMSPFFEKKKFLNVTDEKLNNRKYYAHHTSCLRNCIENSEDFTDCSLNLGVEIKVNKEVLKLSACRLRHFIFKQRNSIKRNVLRIVEIR
jgi:hypothetical protein